MKIICKKDDLVKGITIVQRAVSTKSNLQILEGILIEVNEIIKLTGNNLEIGIEAYIEGDIKEKGSTVINSRIFGDIVRRMPEDEIKIESDEENHIKIECQKSHFEINGLSAEEYPAIPVIKKENEFKINQGIVKEMIRNTIFAVGMDENRPILKGSLIECINNSIRFVSIDGFRLAMYKEQLKGADENERELRVVVPGKTLGEIERIIQNTEEEITLYSTKNQILFDMKECKVISNLLEGEYLNYNSIIPKENEIVVKINRENMLSGIERASLIITSEERKYPIRLSIKKSKMIISSKSEVGEVEEEIDIELEGNEIEASFNPRYFIDALRVLKEESIYLFFTSDVGPCTIKPIDGEEYAHMILPVRK
jgi:DNA polymerase III subunit beta